MALGWGRARDADGVRAGRVRDVDGVRDADGARARAAFGGPAMVLGFGKVSCAEMMLGE
ncbi:hypothetical protein [Nonomuraea sp. B19D2]|uniref:hypothetical protein n=1 Tax=Nonomuraea sp. B19D2 TaxID=3159561 RepID=UPI0032DB4176